MKRRTFTFIFLFVIIFGGGVYYFVNGKKAEIVFQTAKVEKGDITLSITATGKLSPLTSVLVGTQVSGTISKIYVDFNSQVKKGQVIAEIDKTYLEVSVQDAKANVEKAQIQLDQAQYDYDRMKKLIDEKVVAQTDYQVSYSTYKTAKTNLNSMQSQLNRALINVKYATITAPIDGVVISRSVDIGQTVASSFNTPTLFMIANDLSKMQVEASVDEADIGQVKVGQKVSFTVDAFPNDVFEGTVKQVRLLPTVTMNVVTYTVIIAVNNADLKLLPGLTANISVIVEEKDNVLKIPKNALRFTPDEELLKDYMKQIPDSLKQKNKDKASFRKDRSGKVGNKKFTSGTKGKIWVKRGGQIFPVRVITGLSDGTYTEVKGKIKEGDEVVISAGKKEAAKPAAAAGQNPFAPAQRSGGRRGM
jgi:HlyD family secretion protein